MAPLTRLGLKKQLQREKQEKAQATRRAQAEKRREREQERQLTRQMEADAAAAAEEAELQALLEKMNRPRLHRDILVTTFQLLDYTDLMNCQLVSRRFNGIIRNEERCLPMFISDGAAMDTEAHVGWGVIGESECGVTCSQLYQNKSLARELIGQSLLIDMPEPVLRLMMFLPRRVPHATKKRRSSSAVLESMRLFTVHCGATLSSKLMMPVLHWFRHLRDHQFFFKSVTLCPFRMVLWHASAVRDSRHPDVIRCHKLTLQNIVTEDHREWAREMSTTYVRHCKVVRWEIEWAEWDELIWMADFILQAHGPDSSVERFIIDNEQTDQSFLDVFIERFKEAPSVEAMFPEVYVPVLDQLSRERELMAGNLVHAEKSPEGVDVLTYAYSNRATMRRLVVTMKAKCKNLALARKFSVSLKLE